jgi:hypothetical protein
MKRVLGLGCLFLLAAWPVQAGKDESIEGYAEWRRGSVLVVDGQRVRPAPDLKFKAHDEATSFASIPLGYEVKVKGERAPDGTLLAREVEAKANKPDALFEQDLRTAFDQAEADYRKRGNVYEEDEEGKITNIGRLEERGPRVDRVRQLASDLIPPYLNESDFRFYVVRNKEWNAFAAPNGSIYVYTGLLSDLDDDEVAIVLGHEIVHATHEHSRRGYKKQLIWMIPAFLIGAAAEDIESDTKRTAIQLGALLFAMAKSNGYGRAQEDQADRVGLRYAYEGGFDVHKGPGLWNHFAQKYGDTNKVVNFFLGDHSVSKDRARNLERELAVNYRDR